MAERSSRLRTWIGIALGVFFLGLPIGTSIAVFYTDWQWYVDLGQIDVFTTRIVSAWSLAAVFGVIAAGFLYLNLRLARSFAPRVVLVSDGVLPPDFEALVDTIRGKFLPVIDKLTPWICVAYGAINGAAMSAKWTVFRLALVGVPFGETDPQFGRDVGFYVFTLPALRETENWLAGLLVFTTLLTLIMHLLDGGIRPWERLQGFGSHVKAHLSVLLGLIVASRAFEYWLRIWELNLSPRGQVTGASYTDVHATLPGLRIVIAVSLVTAVALIVNIRFKGWRLPAIALGVWVVASVLLLGIWPALIQQFRVAPNEVRAEMPYIERNIAATRKAFGLDTVETRPFAAKENLTAKDVTANSTTLSNVRLWDPAIVSECYQQLQAIRPYYEFHDVDIDRYDIGGKRRQVLVSVRELNTEKLAGQAKTWVNQHLVYTHGYGMVMSPVNEADTRGLPKFTLKDIPPESAEKDLEVKQGGIYFGERTTDYVITKAGIQEFDYPVGDKNAEATYTGDAGVEAGSLLKRIAFALRFGSAQMVFSDYIRSDSRVLWARDLATRLERLAPWLYLEDDPYAVLVDGRIVWVVDGYTTSSMYPYSERREGGLNYLRNSVKVTIDAYDGSTHIYAFDPDEPILKAWASIFPTLIESADKIPAGIEDHFRYPETLFSIQASVYESYHMQDAQVFYNKEDSWQLPGEKAGTPMEPFYVLMRLPGDTTEDFQMILPFVPLNRDNMIGWMTAKSDPDNYGKRIVYTFPKQRLTLGPQQISARIQQDPVISPQITLWNQSGSNVRYGNMLVVPLRESVVYIQPLYLQATTSAIPELTRVLVVYADKVAMESSLEKALLTVFGVDDASTGSAETTGTPRPGTTPDTGRAVDAKRAKDLYDRAVVAQKKGDWATYGSLLTELGRALEALAAQNATATAK